MYFAGIDSGSISTKAAVLDQQKNLVSWSVRATGASVMESGRLCLEEAVSRGNIDKSDIRAIISTGYGRKILKNIVDKDFTEIICHAKGVHHLFPGTRTIIDIGGQDSKVISLKEDGSVGHFIMNEKCAAGTGRFLEVMARALELDLYTMCSLYDKKDKEVVISSICTVFAESEIVGLVSSGESLPNIIWGINKSVAHKIYPMVKRLGLKPEVTMTGGVAYNKGVVHAIEEELNHKLQIPDNPQITGAIGAAIMAHSLNT